jgi:A/G-specific adenine glycosylase
LSFAATERNHRPHASAAGCAPPRAEAARMKVALLRWFETHGRATLPWRVDASPYRVTVSEFMLQQTQVERVIPSFERFVARFGDFVSLAQASRADVVRSWQGLGYNSRAVRLHELARTVRDRHNGTLPRDDDALRALPGVGPYTARAIRAFAFHDDVVALDTNVRRIVHRTQFGLEHPPMATAVELEVAAATLLPRGSAFAFNSALMDLGATICTARAPKCPVCPLRRTCAAGPVDAAVLARASARRPRAPKRERFETTTRYLRGRIVDRLRALPAERAVSLLRLSDDLAPLGPAHGAEGIANALAALEAEGLVERVDDAFRLRL